MGTTSHRVWHAIVASTMAVDRTCAKSPSAEKRKQGHGIRVGAAVFVNRLNSFCRKTTLTKHFRRWHTDEEISSEEGSDVGHEDSPDGTMTREPSSHVGDLWPLPGHHTQSRPLPFDGAFVSRPKSLEGIKTEQPNPVGIGETVSLSAPSAAMSSFAYVRTRTGLTPEQLGVQTSMATRFDAMPMSISPPYGSENGAGIWAPSTIPTKLCPSTFADYLSGPPSAPPTALYFPEAIPQTISQDYQLPVVDIHHEPIPFSPDHSTPMSATMKAEPMAMSVGHGVSAGYSTCATPLGDHHVSMSPAPLSNLPPQSVSIQASLLPCYVLTDNTTQYYQSAVPDWYTRIKPEESWPGVLPSEYFYN